MHWKEILPSYRFIAYMKRRIHETDRDVLTMLYQPLIGAEALSLYFTLTSMASRSPENKVEETHKSLMVLTNCSLDVIFEQRKILEAMKLLNVYREKTNDEIIYYYELIPPLSPEEFFSHDLLSVFLYNRIGSKVQYIKLRNLFKIYEVDEEKLENVTRSFDEVFTTILPSELTVDDADVVQMMNEPLPLEGRDFGAEQLNIVGEQFNYNEFLSLLPIHVPKEELEKTTNKEAILKVAFLYKMEPKEMVNVVQDAMLHTDELDITELRRQAKRRYRIHEADTPPRLGFRSQPEHLRVIKTPPATEKEKVIHYFETISPIEYLEQMNGGSKAFPNDIQIVEDLMFEHKLEPGVVNVLLDYIFKVYNQKLTKSLAYTIAGQFTRKKVKTVEEAMDVAKKEYFAREKSLNKSRQKGSKTNYHSGQKKVRHEPLPKWMTDEAWNKEESDDEQFLEVKKKVAMYKEMLRNT